MSLKSNNIGTDICIVGGGPVGIAVAMMAARSGKSILLAESGSDQHRPEELNEGIIQQAVNSIDKRDTKLTSGPSLYNADYMTTGRTRAPGGSSRKWGVRARLHGPFTLRLVCPEAIDFQNVDGYDIPSWPISFEKVEKYLQKSAVFFGLSQVNFRPNTTQAYKLNKTKFEPGLHYFAPASVVYEQRFNDIKRLKNIETRSGWTLKKIVTNSAQNQLEILEFVNEEGDTHKVNAKYVVIAAGGIENSRILLNAVDEGEIQDPYDLLGRWFMDHPHVSLGILKPNESIAELGNFHDFQERNSNITLGHYSLSENAAREKKLLRFSFSLVGAPGITASPVVASGSRLMKSSEQLYSLKETCQMVLELISHPVDTLRFAHHKFGSGLRHHTALGGWSNKDTQVTDVDVVKIEAMMAQRPSPDNRVRLSQDRDRLGNKKAILQWSWSQPEVESYWQSVKLVKENFDAVEAGEYISPEKLGCGKVPRGGTGWHQMGGTRMSSSPTDGSVDVNCRYHGVENLYVAGSSIFPSSIGYSNPTLTAVAFALRLGDHLASL